MIELLIYKLIRMRVISVRYFFLIKDVYAILYDLPQNIKCTCCNLATKLQSQSVVGKNVHLLYARNNLRGE